MSADAIAALRAGESVILPTDTVYGLCAWAEGNEPTERLYALKGRRPQQPSALLAADLDALRACLPELSARDDAIVRALLPGPYTLILSNPSGRYRWLTGTNADAIGIRVPDLPAAAAEVVAAVGAVTSTSANEPGGPNPREVSDIPADLRGRVGAIVDVGPLPGTPSTVLDFTGPEPRVVREGAAPTADALARVADSLR
jgi:L-threonylcarbamoyladenylate synthase